MPEKTMKEEILEIVKAEGLNVGEEAVEALARVVFKVLPMAIGKANPAVGAIVLPLIALIEPKVMEAIDKIDGQVG